MMLPPYFGMPAEAYATYVNEQYQSSEGIFQSGKGVVGTYPASISNMFSQTLYSVGRLNEDYKNLSYGYEIGIPFFWNTAQEGIGHFAAYKDRKVTQCRPGTWGTLNLGLTAQERTTIFANFDIWTEVGLGDLTDILPMGVV